VDENWDREDYTLYVHRNHDDDEAMVGQVVVALGKEMGRQSNGKIVLDHNDNLENDDDGGDHFHILRASQDSM
jgi:hypothetical protein